MTWTDFVLMAPRTSTRRTRADYGETLAPRSWLARIASNTLRLTFGVPTHQGNCNENQFSDPFTGSDGACMSSTQLQQRRDR